MPNQNEARMQPSDYPSFSFRPKKGIYDKLEDRLNTAVHLSKGRLLNQLLGRYFHVLEAELERLDLTAREANILQDACDLHLWGAGTVSGREFLLPPVILATLFLGKVSAFVKQNAIEDSGRLLELLPHLTPGQALAIGDALERLSDPGQTVQSVGLARRP